MRAEVCKLLVRAELYEQEPKGCCVHAHACTEPQPMAHTHRAPAHGPHAQSHSLWPTRTEPQPMAHTDRASLWPARAPAVREQRLVVHAVRVVRAKPTAQALLLVEQALVVLHLPGLDGRHPQRHLRTAKACRACAWAPAHQPGGAAHLCVCVCVHACVYVCVRGRRHACSRVHAGNPCASCLCASMQCGQSKQGMRNGSTGPWRARSLQHTVCTALCVHSSLTKRGRGTSALVRPGHCPARLCAQAQAWESALRTLASRGPQRPLPARGTPGGWHRRARAPFLTRRTFSDTSRSLSRVSLLFLLGCASLASSRRSRSRSLRLRAHRHTTRA